MSLLFMCIKQKSDFFLKKSSYFDCFSCEFIATLLLPGSGPMFPEVDPDPDLAK